MAGQSMHKKLGFGGEKSTVWSRSQIQIGVAWKPRLTGVGALGGVLAREEEDRGGDEEGEAGAVARWRRWLGRSYGLLLARVSPPGAGPRLIKASRVGAQVRHGPLSRFAFFLFRSEEK